MIDHKIPEAMQYFRAAQMQREGAAALVKSCPPSSASFVAHAAIYLSGYVVECVLKALLITRTPRGGREGLMEDMKSEIKHNLDKLRGLLEKRGLKFPQQQAKEYRIVKSEWSSEMRYFPQKRLREDARLIRECADSIYRWAE